MNRKYLERTVLVLAGIVVGAILGEIALRASDALFPFMARYHLELNKPFMAAHPYLHHTLMPNLSMPVVSSEKNEPYIVETNSLGFRFDEKHSQVKRKGVFRIAVLGGSLIEGNHSEATLPHLLEEALQQATGSSPIEVMNFGVGSYSMMIHYVNLQKYVMPFKPDMVILHFDMTDVFDDNIRYRDPAVFDEKGEPVRVRQGVNYVFRHEDGRIENTMEMGERFALERPFSSREAVQYGLSRSRS